MGTSVLHIKTEVECKVFLFDEEKGVAAPGKYFNLEVRKGVQDLLFISTSKSSFCYRLLYHVEESDTDYGITLNESQFHSITEAPDGELIDGILDEYNVLYSRDGLYLIRCNDDEIKECIVKPTCKIICDYAFSNCNSLSVVLLPEGLTHIGNMAFNECWSLFSITLPDSLVHIGDDAFSECSLSCINLPVCLTHIGRGAFNHRNIKINCNSPRFTFENGCLIDKQEKCLIVCLSEEEKVVIPPDVICIGDDAFRNCEDLTTVVLPDSLERIGKYAFSLCRKLASIKLPSSLKYIDDNAFEGCLSLTEIQFPSKLLYIGTHSFVYCSNLTSINIPINLKHIGDGAFAITSIKNVICQSPHFLYVNGCLIDRQDMKLIACFSNESNIKLVSGITKIGKSAFSGCIISNTIIPQGVTQIDDSAFEDCEELSNIILPDSLISIGANAFSGCYKLSDITLPSSIMSIGNGAFTQQVTISSGLRYRYPTLFEEKGVLEGESLELEPISHIFIPEGTITKFKRLLPDMLHSKLIEMIV